jgi:hypothetical protein
MTADIERIRSSFFAVRRTAGGEDSRPAAEFE